MKRPILIGIAGGSGSGKSTLAKNLSAIIEGAILITHDDYYKVVNSKTEDYNYDHPSAFDNELLSKHLDSLLSGEEIDAPIYDYAKHERSEITRHVKCSDIIILEGILTLENEELRKRMSLKIFVDTSEEERLRRRIKRDVNKRGRTEESVREQFKKTVKPMHEAFVEPSKYFADLIIIGGGKDPETVAKLARRIKKLSEE